MRRWLLLPIVAVPALLGACGNGSDDAADDESPEVVTDLDRAVDVARLSIPRSIGDDVVAELIADLCSAAGTGDVETVAGGLQAAQVDAADLPAALDAIAAGASTYCPDDVDEVVPTVEQALAPTTTTTPTVPDAAQATTAAPGSSSRSTASGSTGSSSATSGSSSSNSGSSGSSNSSAGSADVGGGNANGTGNQSSTGLTQGVGSSSNSSSANGSTSNVANP